MRPLISYMYITIAVLLTIGTPVQLRAQMKIGQSLPDSIFHNVFNYGNSSLKMSDIDRKLVIFDFWSFTCASCLHSFAKLDSLQRIFKDDIQIILVNQESRDDTENLFKNRKTLVKPNVPFITSDTVLHDTFGIIGKPALAWFNHKRIFQGMTNSVSSEDLRRFLQTKTVDTDSYVRQPEYRPNHFDTRLSNSMTYYSYIAKHQNGINLLYTDSTLSKSPATILDLYIAAYDPLDNKRYKRPGRLIMDRQVKDAVQAQNLYDYLLHVPNTGLAERHKIMQQDLKRYFGFDVKVEKRLLSSFVLVRTSDKDKLKTLGSEPKMTFFASNPQMDDIQSEERVLINRPFRFFSNILGGLIESRFNRPFIDQTNYSGLVDIRFNANTLDEMELGTLKIDLKKYDLDLIEQEIWIDVLSITQSK